MQKILKYVVVDILRNRIVLAYTLFLLIISFAIFNLEDNAEKGLLSLLNIILFIVPLISIIFSTIYFYNSSEFIELMVSQPIRRKSIWLSLFGGLAASLGVAFLIGAGLPILVYQPSKTGLLLVVAGLFLTIIFIAIALFSSVITRDKAKGIGVSILLWLYFSLIFDGFVLFILFQFADYPLEKIIVGISSLNPIDLSRILVLLQLDTSALMGYTGAVFKDFFGTVTGITVSFFVLALWIVVPVYFSLRKFKGKDL